MLIARSRSTDLFIIASAIERLLAAILTVHEVKMDYEKLAEIMGPQCTKRAVQEIIKKLKKNSVVEQPAGASVSTAQPKVSLTFKRQRQALTSL